MLGQGGAVSSWSERSRHCGPAWRVSQQRYLPPNQPTRAFDCLITADHSRVSVSARAGSCAVLNVVGSAPRTHVRNSARRLAVLSRRKATSVVNARVW